MKSIARLFLALLVLLVVAAPAVGQKSRRDPLTPAEADELREKAQEPDDRVRLFARFIRERAGALQQTQTDPRFTAERSTRIHGMLDDITALVDEMDDNIDQYDARKADLRKALQDVITVDSDLLNKLRAMKQTGIADASQNADSKEFAFALDTAIDTVNGSLDNARKLIPEQEERIKAEKAAKKKK